MNEDMVHSAGPAGEFPQALQKLTWLWWLIGSLGIVVTAYVLQFVPPDQIVIPIVNVPLPQTCWTRRWLGFSCPGCGMTRSFVLAAHGRFAEAFEMHPVGTILFGLLVLQIPIRLYQGANYWKDRHASNIVTRPNPAGFRGLRTEFWVFLIATVSAFAWWGVTWLDR